VSPPYPPFMRLLGSIPTVAAGGAIAIALLASCSSGHGSSSSTTSTPTSLDTTSTVSAGSTASTAPVSATPTTRPVGRSTTTVAATPTTSSGGSTAPTVRVAGYRITPPSPVSCNAPTEIELQWTTSGATKVTLSVDGRLFATYGPGPQDHLEYFACDGRVHSYTLRAEGGGSTASATKFVTSA
jgi:hypothetical protein